MEGYARKKVRIDLSGKTFGKLRVDRRAKDYVDCSNRLVDMWYCDCSCGTKGILIRGESLRGKRTRSCGCYRNETRKIYAMKAKPRSNSGVIGVSWNSRYKRWVAKIGNDGKRVHLGSYKNVEDAIAARKAAEIKYGYC